MTAATHRRAPEPGADAAPSLGHIFLDRVEATPDAEAFRSRAGAGWESLTWKQTRDRVFELAAGLVDLGVRAEQRVAIASGTRLEWILSDLAVMCAGAATTTVYPSTAADEVGYILADSGSVVLIAENAEQLGKLANADLPELTAVVLFDLDGVDGLGHPDSDHTDPGSTDPGRPWPIVSFAELAERGRTRLQDSPDLITERIQSIGPDNLSTLIYTSGTTGRPKGVQLVHANWTYESQAVAALDILRPDDVQYLWLPLSHVLGKMLIAIQLHLGFATAVDGDLTKIVENLAAVQPTFMGGAPRVFEKVRAKVTMTAQGGGGVKAKIFDWAFGVGIRASRLRQQRKPVAGLLKVQLAVADRLVLHRIRALLGGRIRFFVSGSAQLSPDVAEWFDAAGLTILEGYGLTETSAAIAVNLPTDTRIGTVGPALPGSEFMIAADGEILARGGGVMRGYHHNQSATEDVLTADGWIHTGDIGELVDGYLKVTDRKKDLIKTSGGKYVAPQKVETIFKAICPYASQIVVHGEGRRFVSALITLDPDAIGEWAEKNGLVGVPPNDLASDPKVIDLMAGYIDELNAKLEHWETIKKFWILPRDLSVDDGELTPSMKVRRKVVEKKYMDVLDTLYA